MCFRKRKGKKMYMPFMATDFSKYANEHQEPFATKDNPLPKKTYKDEPVKPEKE